MATVFTHTTIVTVDRGGTVLHDAALAVDGSQIAAVGPTEEVIRAFPGAEVFEGRGKAIFPGLINCHAHLPATIDRGITEDFGFPPDIHLPARARNLLTPEELTVMALLGALECIRSGNTTTLEYAQGIAGYAEELVKTGLRWVFAESGSDAVTPPEWRPGEDVYEFSPALRDEAVERMNDLFSKWHGAQDNFVTCFSAAALVESSSPELLRAVREMAERHGAGYTIHLDQSRLEVESIQRIKGVRPGFYLYASDFLGPQLIAAHCRYVDSSEIALLGNARTIVTHQPAMAGNRAVIPPIPALRAAGCLIAMGTDNNTQDMVEGMRVGLVTERILKDDPTRPQPEDVLREATVNGARALGMDQRIGSLEVGKSADLFVIDTQKAHLVPTMRIVSGFVHNGQPSDIEAVMVNGKFVMRDHKVLTVDEDAIIAEADRIGRRVWNRLLETYPSAPFPTRVAPPL